MLQTAARIVGEVAPPWGSNRLEIYVEGRLHGPVALPNVGILRGWEQGAPQVPGSPTRSH